VNRQQKLGLYLPVATHRPHRVDELVHVGPRLSEEGGSDVPARWAQG
jgi:hypothetical protein